MHTEMVMKPLSEIKFLISFFYGYTKIPKPKKTADLRRHRIICIVYVLSKKKKKKAHNFS